MAPPEHRGGRATPSAIASPLARRAPRARAGRCASPRGRVHQGVRRQRPAPAAASSRRVAESGVVRVRIPGGRASASPAAAAATAAPASRSSPSGVRPGPRPSSPSAARQRAAASSLPNAARIAAPPPPTVAARSAARGRLRRRRATPNALRSPRRAGRARTRFDPPHHGVADAVGRGPSAIALGSRGVPGGVSNAMKPSPS